MAGRSLVRGVVRRLPIQHKVASGFGFALLVLLVIGAVTYQSMTLFLETTVAVGRSHVILRRLEELLTCISDAEAGTRGYVITGGREYLTYYETARAAAIDRLGEIRTLTSRDLAQQAHLDSLDAMIVRRLDVSLRTVELRDTAGPDAAAALVRTGIGRALSDSIHDLIHIIQARQTAELNRRAAQERPAARRVTIVTAVGFLFAFGLSVLATAVVRRDVAERRRAEREMLQARDSAEAANRAKSDFLARMSHELRTPLNSVIGFANVLRKNKAGNLRPQDLTYLDRIVAGGEHLLDLINDVLDLSKVEAGRLTVEREPMALDAAIHDVIASLEGQLRNDHVTLRAELPERLARIESDPVRLHQVLTNLVGNAVKFTHHGSVIVAVEAEPRTGRPLRVDVIDTGIGIAPERHEAVFGAFEQADTTTTRRYGGTGLGLAIARSLCQLMGYRLELSWSEPGRGSVFSIRLAPDAPPYAGGAPAATEVTGAPA